MDARSNPYVPLTSDNAALVLVDHQVGLLTGVRDIPVAELKNNVVSLGKAMRILKVPIVVTTTARASMWGPTFPELVQALPEIDIIDRASVNVWDDAQVSKAIEATGRTKLIFAGVSLEVCAAFPAITAMRVPSTQRSRCHLQFSSDKSPRLTASRSPARSVKPSAVAHIGVDLCPQRFCISKGRNTSATVRFRLR
jgi:hypothetical protein